MVRGVILPARQHARAGATPDRHARPRATLAINRDRWNVPRFLAELAVMLIRARCRGKTGDRRNVSRVFAKRRTFPRFQHEAELMEWSFLAGDTAMIFRRPSMPGQRKPQVVMLTCAQAANRDKPGTDGTFRGFLPSVSPLPGFTTRPNL
jgi:hypothetical protein